MRKTRKLDERMMLDQFQPGKAILPPLILRHVDRPHNREVDANIEVSVDGEDEGFRFIVECKSRSTPESVKTAIAQATHMARMQDTLPMIQVPYLSPERLEELEALGVSGIDLCGNGFVIVPNRLCVLRTGQPNLYPDSRSVINPFQGRSALVARMLLIAPQWNTLSELTQEIERKSQGKGLSISQVSKATTTLTEELIVTKDRNRIILSDPIRLLDRLGSAWEKPQPSKQGGYKLANPNDWANRLSRSEKLNWSLTGESSASRYTVIAQGGPKQIAVSDFELAEALLDAVPESVPSFADIVLLETDEDGYFFANQQEADGTRIASRTQTWVELNNGDARQRDTARDLYRQLIMDAQRCPEN